MTPQPPVPFPAVNLHELAAGTILHRNHVGGFAACAFNPCLGEPSRFAPFTDAAGHCVPTLYAASSREAAAFETIFHDIAIAAAFKTVRMQRVTGRAASRLELQRTLRLAGLFAPDLTAWGRRRRDLIDTPKSSYAQTVRWAAAIHHAHASVQGLIWTSRQCDPAVCVMLFGDRVPPDSLTELECLAVESNAALLLELRGYGRRAGITIVN